MNEAAAGLAAIVLAGGRGARMGGIDKPGLELGGATLLEHAMAAARAAGCEPVIVIGPEAGGGPVAAVAAGLIGLTTNEIVVLAGDLVHPDRILAALASSSGRPGGRPDGVVLVDADGREQWLAARYRVAALRAALAALGDPVDASFRRLVGGLDLGHVLVDADAIADIDTWEDYERAKEQAND